MKTEKQPKRGEEESEKLRLMNITLQLRELELKCAQDELNALKGLQDAADEVPSDIEEPDGAVGGTVNEQYRKEFSNYYSSDINMFKSKQIFALLPHDCQDIRI
ncbi:hypothetical protein BSL78_05511 [Apostichopus japonicus]|nr:hypothetical protein BSL78_05511 [Apostichopus japonicus]